MHPKSREGLLVAAGTRQGLVSSTCAMSQRSTHAWYPWGSMCGPWGAGDGWHWGAAAHRQLGAAPLGTACTLHPAPRLGQGLWAAGHPSGRGLWLFPAGLGGTGCALGWGYDPMPVPRGPVPSPALHSPAKEGANPALPSVIRGTRVPGHPGQGSSCAPATRALSPSPSSSCHPGLPVSTSRTTSGARRCRVPDSAGCPGMAQGFSAWQSPAPSGEGTREEREEEEEEEEAGARAARVFSFVASWLAGCWRREITEWESVGCAVGRRGRGRRHGTGAPAWHRAPTRRGL